MQHQHNEECRRHLCHICKERRGLLGVTQENDANQLLETFYCLPCAANSNDPEIISFAEEYRKIVIDSGMGEYIKDQEIQ